MTTRKCDLTKIDTEWSPSGVAAKVRGGAIASQSSRDAALYTQMRILPHGRRLLARAGLGGGTAFMVPDGTNPHNVSKIYPNKTSERVMARQKCRLTPGYTIRVTGIFAPSGPTQTPTPSGGFYEEDSGVSGVRFTVLLGNGISNVTKSITLVPKFSNETYKALPTDLWAALEKMTKVFNFAELKTAGWTEGVTATITVTALGGVRPVDLTVSEEPNSDAQQDDTHRECSIPMVKAAGVESEYAITGYSYTGNARGGSHQAAKSMRDQRQVCGPMLAYWSCWNEAVATVGATEGVAVSATSTSFADILGNSVTTWASTNPGWSVSSGGTARTLEQSGPLELRGVNGVVPVICRAYMKSGGGGSTATVKLQTESYSLRELTSTSSSYAWVEGLAWMRCGIHQTDQSNLQVFIKSSSISFAASIAYLSVEVAGNYTITP